MTKKYDLKLDGVRAFDLPVETLRELCDLFLEGARRCARLVAEGRSVARGPAPTWLNDAADVRLTNYASASLDLVIQAPVLAAAVPELFAQQKLFPDHSGPDATAVDLLVEAMRDASSNRRDSDRLDSGVLEILEGTRALFARGGSKLTICGDGSEPLVLEPRGAEAIESLAREVPASRVSRVRGLLDTVTSTTRAFVLKIGERDLRGNASAIPLDRLKELFGREVVVEGWVTFRPSGDAVRIEAESLAPAEEGDAIWGRLPFAEPRGERPRVVATSGLAALFGRWPGDETDDELVAALADMR